MDDFKNVFSFEGKTALIVGGGGIGLPIAQALMENGADIILAGAKEKKAENPLPEIAKKNHKKYFFVKVDLLDAKSCTNMAEEAALKTGRIDILVNAAGVNKLKKRKNTMMKLGTMFLE
nr:SDR family NAD(P)-dependent oxidoreductase [Treponema parvum]